MKEITNFKDDLLIIAPNKYQEKILKELYQAGKVYRLKFMTKEELMRQFLFDYDFRSVAYLMERYHYKVDVCNVYLKNMYYLEEKKYTSSKLNHLLSLKKELEQEHLLWNNPLFSLYLKQVEVWVVGYDKLDRFDENLFDQVRKITKVEIKPSSMAEEKPVPVYAFDTLEEEIDFVAVSILELVRGKKVPLSSIQITNVDEEYLSSLKRIFDFYHLPLELPRSSVYGTMVIKSFLQTLRENGSIEESFHFTEEVFSNETELLTVLRNCCNQVVGFSFSKQSQITILTSLLKEATLPPSKERDKIQIVDFKEVEEEFYVFVMGMNQNMLPRLYKDEDYISDLMKEEVPLSLTSEKNRMEKQSVKNKLYSLKHGIVTYKKRSPFQEYYPSSLLDEMLVTMVENPSYPKYRYSSAYNQIKLAKKLDRFIKYQEQEPGLISLYQRYPSIPYQSYQNQFTGLSRDTYLEAIHHSLLLSYTSINEYNLCGFRYYLSRVLKLNDFEETFPIFVGNLYHKLLSLAYLCPFDFEEAFLEYTKQRDLTVKEAFWLKKLKEELKEILRILKEQKELSSFRQELYEKEIYLSLPSSLKVVLKGTIDKIMYQEFGGQTYLAVVDYKSGGVHTSISNMIYGLDLQLPIYLYLIKKSSLFSKPVFAGFYFQKILHGEVVKKTGSTVLDQKRDRLKLQGYSLDQEEVLEQLDESYQNSTMIKGMKTTSKGFSTYAKVVSEEDITKILELTEEKIKEAVLNIQQANFSIDPKKIGKENVSCTYCPYQDICYHTEKDLVYLKEYHGLEFLGGE